MDTESIYECFGRIEYVANHPEAYDGPEPYRKGMKIV